MAEQKARIDMKGGDALSLALGTKMLVEPVGMGEQFKTHLVGMERGHYIIVRFPLVPGVREHVHVDKQVKVRYVHGGNLYGFHSEIKMVVAARYKLLFLQYPITVEILNLRQCRRMDCYLPVTVNLGGDWCQGLILNISGGGCQVAVEVKEKNKLPNITVDDDVTLDFKMPYPDKVMHIIIGGKTKNIYVQSDRICMGVEYDEFPESHRDSIEKYVQHIMEYLEEQ